MTPTERQEHAAEMLRWLSGKGDAVEIGRCVLFYDAYHRRVWEQPGGVTRLANKLGVSRQKAWREIDKIREAADKKHMESREIQHATGQGWTATPERATVTP